MVKEVQKLDRVHGKKGIRDVPSKVSISCARRMQTGIPINVV